MTSAEAAATEHPTIPPTAPTPPNSPVDRRTSPGKAPRVFDDPPPPLPLGDIGGHADGPGSQEGSPPADLRAPVAGDKASVPLSDLTPAAPSALDLDEDAWSISVAAPQETYAQEPLADPALEPPRGILQIAAGAVFVTVLLTIAWYLATNL